MRMAATVMVLVGLVGCSSTPSKGELDVVAQAKENAPKCTSAEMCAAGMTAAKAYLAEYKFAPVETDTPDLVKTFEQGAYWSITPTAIIERKAVSDGVWGIYARFGLYMPGEAPMYSPKMYKRVLHFNEYVAKAMATTASP